MKKHILIESTIAAILGYCAIAIFTVLSPSFEPTDTWIFSFFQEIVEKMNSHTFLLLALIGFLIAFFGRAPSLIIGASTMAIFPIISLLDMLAGSFFGRSDHNLFPIEWFIYMLISIYGIAGAICGRIVRNFFRRLTTE